jgi:hypothetical protein
MSASLAIEDDRPGPSIRIEIHTIWITDPDRVGLM